jgi:putative Mg2+ transporter-C (MgtC) family protein
MNFDPEFLPLITLLLPKVLIATICGLIIGYDREIKQKVAGIRTNILICVGCAILTTTSFYLAKDNPNIDPTRIIGQIITGIGFLGAGVIMKNDDKIVGVTTAAFIWVISSIGILIACTNSFSTPIILTIGLLIISRIFEKVETYIKNKSKE